jgi:hypothetical protein
VAAGAGIAAAAGAAAAMAASGNKDTGQPREETVAGTTPAVPAEPVGPAEPLHADTAAAGTTGTSGSVADLDDSRIGHPFDQTNGLVDTAGESDDTVAGENLSAAERDRDDNDLRRDDGGLPPVSGNLGQH